MFRIDRTRVNLSGSMINHSPQGRPISQEMADEALRQEKLAAETIIAEAEAEAAALREKAAALLSAAEQSAEELQAAVERSAEELRAAAEQSGYEAGYSAGMAAAESECARMRAENDEALRRVIAEVEEKHVAMLDGAEAELIDLCFAVIRKIATLDRTKDGEIFKAAIKKTLSQLDLTGRFTISLCQEDYERFFPTGEGVFTFGGAQVTVTILEDPALCGGEIMVETDRETLAAGMDAQIKNIELAFRRRLGKKNEQD